MLAVNMYEWDGWKLGGLDSETRQQGVHTITPSTASRTLSRSSSDMLNGILLFVLNRIVWGVR